MDPKTPNNKGAELEERIDELFDMEDREVEEDEESENE